MGWRDRRSPDRPPKPASSTREDPGIVRGRCACGQRYRIKDPGPDVQVLCPACGRPLKLRQLEFSISTGTVRPKAPEPEARDPRMAILRDYGELGLAADGARPGLTGEKIYTNSDALLLGAQNQWPEGWSLYERPAEEATEDWLAAGPPVPRAPLADSLASLWFAGAPRNLVSVFLWSVLWWIVAPMFVWLRPSDDLRSCFALMAAVAIPFILLTATLRYFALVIRDTAVGEDDVTWLRPGGPLWRDGLGPPAALLGWLGVPAWLLADAYCCLHVSLGHPASAAGLVGVHLGLTYALPVLLLGAVAGDWLGPWRPRALLRNLGAGWPLHGVAWLAGLVCAGVWLFWPSVLRERVETVWSGASLRLVWLLAGFYASYVAARSIGLMARHRRGRLSGFSALAPVRG